MEGNKKSKINENIAMNVRKDMRKEREKKREVLDQQEVRP